MDDLLFFTPYKKSHKGKLEDLLKELLKNGLMISAKSANCLRICGIWEILFYTRKEGMHKTHKMRIEAIQYLKPPTTLKGYRSFAGAVNFLSLFCPEVKTLLKTYINVKGFMIDVPLVQ